MKTNELMEECRKKFSDLKIQQRVNIEVGYIDRAYMIGYNNAIEKALEWLEICVHEYDNGDYYIVGFTHETKEEVLNDFKQYLHPYSVEQIDNCIDMK